MLSPRCSSLLATMVVTSLLLSSTSLALAAKQELVCGKPKNDGSKIRFTLVAPDEKTQKIEVAIAASNTAVQKAAQIEAAVNTADRDNWKANRTDNKLTFQHKEGGEYKDISTIEAFDDVTCEVTRWNALAAAIGIYDVRLTALNAAGVDPSGAPSVVNVSTTLGSASVPLNLGMAPSQVMDNLFSQLDSDGVDVTRLTSLSLRISDRSTTPFVSIEVTDTTMAVEGSRAMAVAGVPAISGLRTWTLVVLLTAVGLIALGKRLPRAA